MEMATPLGVDREMGLCQRVSRKQGPQKDKTSPSCPGLPVINEKRSSSMGSASRFTCRLMKRWRLTGLIMSGKENQQKQQKILSVHCCNPKT